MHLDRNLQLGLQKRLIIQCSNESLGPHTCASKKLAVEMMQLPRRSYRAMCMAQIEPWRKWTRKKLLEVMRDNRQKNSSKAAAARGIGQRTYSTARKGGLCQSHPAGFANDYSPVSAVFWNARVSVGGKEDAETVERQKGQMGAGPARGLPKATLLF